VPTTVTTRFARVDLAGEMSGRISSILIAVQWGSTNGPFPFPTLWGLFVPTRRVQKGSDPPDCGPLTLDPQARTRYLF
jgi:hypothetical protein